MENLILIGGGGHCKACIDVIESTNKFNIIGILDREELIGTEVLGYPVLGTDEEIDKYSECAFLITVGQIKSSSIRAKIYKILKDREYKLATVISYYARVSKHAIIQEGSIIMHGAVVNANANIGENSIINTLSLIEHDVFIGSHSHISTGAIINGNSRVESHCFIGSQSVVSNQINIVENVIVGAGSLVVSDINEFGIYVGNPVKKIN
jgi:sugar O-acyltransferase (sialic acid O-acetyltransferase NeuD family)